MSHVVILKNWKHRTRHEPIGVFFFHSCCMYTLYDAVYTLYLRIHDTYTYKFHVNKWGEHFAVIISVEFVNKQRFQIIYARMDRKIIFMIFFLYLLFIIIMNNYYLNKEINDKHILKGFFKFAKFNHFYDFLFQLSN